MRPVNLEGLMSMGTSMTHFEVNLACSSYSSAMARAVVMVLQASTIGPFCIGG